MDFFSPLASYGTWLEIYGICFYHTLLTSTHKLCQLIQSCCVLRASACWLLVGAVVVLLAVLNVGLSSGGLGAWWAPSVSSLSPSSKPSSSSSSSWSSSSSLIKGSCGQISGGAEVSLSCWRRLSRLLRSFLSFCRALHSRSSSSSFPWRALKCPSRRVFYNTKHFFNNQHGLFKIGVAVFTWYWIMIIFSLMGFCHERNQKNKKSISSFLTRNYHTLWVKLNNSLIELIQT